MEVYIIIALSFGIMFAYRYTRDIIYSIKEVARIHEVRQRHTLLNLFAFNTTVLSIVLMPIYALVVLFSDRQELIRSWSRLILVKYYDVELKI